MLEVQSPQLVEVYIQTLVLQTSSSQHASVLVCIYQAVAPEANMDMSAHI